jgi:SARP family transcriptional regulator, regulator of embCAB operon
LSEKPREESRIQLCGRFVFRLRGEEFQDSLSGTQARLLLAYLVMNRDRPAERSSLASALWGDDLPRGAETSLRGLIFRLRQALGPDRLDGKNQIRLRLPDHVTIDVESALSGIHRAESAVAQSHWKEAWLPARIAASVTGAGFMRGCESAWVEEQRQALDEVRVRALDCIAQVGLGLGGPELDASERAGRALIEAAPFRESGYLYLIEALAARDNVAEALLVYDEVRTLLRDELGIAPGARLKEAHERLLGAQPL